jgi:hypothetical protein
VFAGQAKEPGRAVTPVEVPATALAERLKDP